MSRRSKWVTARHRKAAIDAKRGKLSTRLIKNIEVTARTGGGDPAGNPTLFDAIQKAKKNSVFADNVTRAVKRGSGAEADGTSYETIMYEDYGPGGVAFYAGCLTDNHNRAASDAHLVFTRSDGFMAGPGSMTFLFSHCGIVEVATAEGVDEDSIMEVVLKAGAEEVENLGGGFVIEPDPSGVVEVHRALQVADIGHDSTEVQFAATTEVELSLEDVVRVQRLVDTLEDSDDVQNIYRNMTVSGEVRVQLEKKE